MLKPVKVTETECVFGAVAVCVLYAKARYANEGGVVTECPTPISGVFQAWSLEISPRKDKEGFQYVYVWCDINDIQPEDVDEEAYWIVLKVPAHGLIELPNYDGEVIRRMNVS